MTMTYMSAAGFVPGSYRLMTYGELFPGDCSSKVTTARIFDTIRAAMLRYTICAFWSMSLVHSGL
jgi:hypothetical protein